MAMKPYSALLPTKDAGATGPILVDGNRVNAIFHIVGGTSSTGKVRVEALVPLNHGDVWCHLIEIPLSGARNIKSYCIQAPGMYRFTKTSTGKAVGIFTYGCS